MRTMKKAMCLLTAAAAAGLVASVSIAAAQPSPPPARTAPPAAAPTAAEADAFVARAEHELADFSVLNNRASWVNEPYITQDTDALAAYFGTIGPEMQVRRANDTTHNVNTPRLRPHTTHRPDPRRSARQSLGTGMGQCLRRGRAAGFGPARLRPHPFARAAALYARADRPHRRALFHLIGLRAPAGDLLDPLANHPAARPR